MANGWDEKEFLEACICERCPTYIDCGKKGAKKEKAFCFPTGKSACIMEEHGCICGACPMHQKMRSKNYYFCTKGSEEKQDKK